MQVFPPPTYSPGWQLVTHWVPDEGIREPSTRHVGTHLSPFRSEYGGFDEPQAVRHLAKLRSYFSPGGHWKIQLSLLEDIISEPQPAAHFLPTLGVSSEFDGQLDGQVAPSTLSNLLKLQAQVAP